MASGSIHILPCSRRTKGKKKKKAARGRGGDGTRVQRWLIGSLLLVPSLIEDRAARREEGKKNLEPERGGDKKELTPFPPSPPFLPAAKKRKKKGRDTWGKKNGTASFFYHILPRKKGRGKNLLKERAKRHTSEIAFQPPLFFLFPKRERIKYPPRRGEEKGITRAGPVRFLSPAPISPSRVGLCQGEKGKEKKGEERIDLKREGKGKGDTEKQILPVSFCFPIPS